MFHVECSSLSFRSGLAIFCFHCPHLRLCSLSTPPHPPTHTYTDLKTEKTGQNGKSAAKNCVSTQKTGNPHYDSELQRRLAHSTKTHSVAQNPKFPQSTDLLGITFCKKHNTVKQFFSSFRRRTPLYF